MPGLALRLGANSTFCFVISLSSAIKPVKMRLWKSRKFLKPGRGGIGPLNQGKLNWIAPCSPGQELEMGGKL